MTHSAADASGLEAERSGFPGLVPLALWFGIVTGLVEGGYVVARARSYDLGVAVLWMAPLADLLWFMALAGALALGRRIRPAWFGPRGQLTAFIGLGCVAILLLPRQLSGYAALLLGLGCGIQAGRLAASRLAMVGAVIRRTVWPLAGTMALLTLGLVLVPRYLERQANRRLPTAAAGAPNVLLLVLDTARGMNLSLAGYGRPTTPGLERWAERGVRFEHAIATTSWTLPSHASMFTGRLPGELSASWLTPLDNRYPTLAGVLRARGYATGGFVANPTYCPRDYGLSQGFTHFEDYSLKPGEFLISSSLGRVLSKSRRARRLMQQYDIPGRKSAGDVTSALLAWLGRQDPSRPFFGFVNFFDAHQPYLPPADFDRRFASATPRRLALIYRQGHFVHEAALSKAALTAAEREREMEAYDAAIAYIDSEISQLLDTLGARGMLDNTLVIVTGDHGEQFGEHGLFDHGNSLYRQVIEVPLLLLVPGTPASRVIREPVSLKDLAATVLDVTGAGEGLLPGRSWRRYFSGEPIPSGAAEPAISQLLTSKGKIWLSSIRDSLHYLRMEGGTEELYHLGRDPQETVNVVHRPEFADALESLRASLDSLPSLGAGTAPATVLDMAIDSTLPHRSNESSL